MELGRQCLRQVCVERMDALAVGLQRLAGVGGQAGILLAGMAHDVERTHELVSLQRGGPEDFGQFAVHYPAVEFQLPGALLRMHVTHGKPRIARRLRPDVRDIGRIALHAHSIAQSAHHDPPIQRRKSTLHIQGNTGTRQQDAR